MPCGEYFTSYVSRMGLVRWRTERIAFVLALPIPFLLPMFLDPGTVSVITQIYIFTIAVLGLNVMLGYAGEIVLAQAAFMAIGAYSTAQIIANVGMGLLPAVLVGGLFTAVVSILFGLPSYRVKGFYIAISTLALQFITEWFFEQQRFEPIHGGPVQTDIPTEIALVDALGVINISSGQDIYYFAFALMTVVALVTLNISRTGIGRRFRAVKENDLSSAVLGINVFRTKLLAYGLGGFIVGVAGGLYAFYLTAFTPGQFGIDLTLEHYLMLLLGGIGRVWGAVIGVSVVVLLQEELDGILQEVSPQATSLEPLFFGVVIIIYLALEPKGIVAGLGQIKEYLRSWPYAY